MIKEDMIKYYQKWIPKFIYTGKFKIFVDGHLFMSNTKEADVEVHLQDWLSDKSAEFSIIDGGFVLEITLDKKHSFKIERDFVGD